MTSSAVLSQRGTGNISNSLRIGSLVQNGIEFQCLFIASSSWKNQHESFENISLFCNSESNLIFHSMSISSTPISNFSLTDGICHKYRDAALLPTTPVYNTEPKSSYFQIVHIKEMGLFMNACHAGIRRGVGLERNKGRMNPPLSTRRYLPPDRFWG